MPYDDFRDCLLALFGVLGSVAFSRLHSTPLVGACALAAGMAIGRLIERHLPE